MLENRFHIKDNCGKLCFDIYMNYAGHETTCMGFEGLEVPIYNMNALKHVSHWKVANSKWWSTWFMFEFSFLVLVDGDHFKLVAIKWEFEVTNFKLSPPTKSKRDKSFIIALVVTCDHLKFADFHVWIMYDRIIVGSRLMTAFKTPPLYVSGSFTPAQYCQIDVGFLMLLLRSNQTFFKKKFEW